MSHNDSVEIKDSQTIKCLGDIKSSNPRLKSTSQLNQNFIKESPNNCNSISLMKNEPKKEERTELIHLILEISEGREENIIVYNDDKADDLANSIIDKYNLPKSIANKLRANIQQTIDEASKSNIPKNSINLPETSQLKETRNSNNEVNKSDEKLSINPQLEITSNRKINKNIGVYATSRNKSFNGFNQHKSSFSSTNIGEKLYEKGIAYINKRKEMRAKMMKYRELMSKRSITPSVNPKKLTNFEDRLSKRSKKSAEKNFILVNLRNKKQNAECTFKPNINDNSRRLANSKSEYFTNRVDKFEFLFDDAKRKKSYKEKISNLYINNECTFHPYIKHKKHINPNHHNSESPKKVIKNSHIPKVGRGPKKERNKNKLPIGEYLHSRNGNIKAYFTTIEESSIVHNKSFVQPKSNKLADNKKINNLKNIFKILDSDSDGIISNKNINIEGICNIMYRSTKRIEKDLRINICRFKK